MINRRAIIVALVVSMIFSLALWKVLQQDQNKKNIIPVVAMPPKIPTVPVVVARQRIPPRTLLEPERLHELFEIREIVASAAPPDAFSDIASLSKKYTGLTILPGDIVTPNRILDKDIVPSLSFAVPQGKRAVTIAVTKTSGVGGFIQQGDYVDVIATFKPGTPDSITKVVLQDILVLAAGTTYAFEPEIATPTPAIAASKLDLVTLAVTPEELEWLVYLDSSVTYRLVLKNPKDKGEQVKTKGATEKIVMQAVDDKNADIENRQVTTNIPSLKVEKLIAPIDTEKVEIMYGSQRHFEMTRFGIRPLKPSAAPIQSLAGRMEFAPFNPSATEDSPNPE